MALATNQRLVKMHHLECTHKDNLSNFEVQCSRLNQRWADMRIWRSSAFVSENSRHTRSSGLKFRFWPSPCRTGNRKSHKIHVHVRVRVRFLSALSEAMRKSLSKYPITILEITITSRENKSMLHNLFQ